MARQRSEKLYSLSEVAARTGISLASLRRYRAQYPERVLAVGVGRRQRFPEASLAVFRTLKDEGVARRGRRSAVGARGAAVPRRAGKRPAPGGKRGGRGRVGGKRPRKGVSRSGAAAGGADRETLLTLVRIGRMTGISYPTLLRYVRLYLDRLPHTGSGRKRRFRPGAVAEFQKLRQESRRGRRSGPRAAAVAPSVARQLAKLERGQRALASQLRDLRKALARPIRIKLER